MSIVKTKILFFFVIALSISVSAKSFQKIEVKGLQRIDSSAVLEKMAVKQAQSLTTSNVRKSILNIFSLGFFSDVKIDLLSSKLVVSVKERPVLSEIVFSGHSEFDNEELMEFSELSVFRVVNLSELQKAQTIIQKKYEEKGYYLAQAPFELTPVADRPNEVSLKFDIQENEQVKIRKIVFSGNENFSSPDLKKIMMTREGNFFSWMTGGGTYREDYFERDLQALAYFYGNEGFVQAKFSKPRVMLSQDRRYIDIMIDVTEGDRFFINDLSFSGDVDFSEDRLLREFALKKGSVFSTGQLQQGVVKLTDLYGDKGYAFANVVPQPKIDAATKKVDLNIRIQKGRKIYWGKLKVSGNQKTHDKVVRRELKFYEGDLYNAAIRKKSFANIQRLGFFEDVKFLTKTNKKNKTVLDLEVRVREKPTGTLNLQAGYGSESKFVFGGSLGQRNLFGRGQQLNLSVNIADNDSSSYNLSFTDPKIFDSEWLFGIDSFLSQSRVGPQDDQNFTYLRKSIGGGLRLGRSIADYTSLVGRYRFSLTKLKDPINPNIFTSADDADNLISSLGVDLSYDKRNSRIDPSAGMYFSAGTEWGGLGGRVFQEFNLNARYYQRLFWKFVYRFNMSYSYLTNFLTDESVPDSERYVLGGPQSLRGYNASTVGTSKLLTNTRNPPSPNPAKSYVIGGTQKFVINNEIEFPLIADAGIRGVLLFDVGNTWSTSKEAGPLLSNYGWGLRWYSPMGPLRFEWGRALVDSEFTREGELVFNFMISPTF